MPQSGMRWRLVTISTYASWLPGDARGFRTKQHKIHSSGDYKRRPPKDEHAGLLRYARSISGQTIIIPRRCRKTVGKAMLRKLRKLEYRTLSLSVSGMHAHILVELPDDLRAIRHIIGQCKTVASHAIRDVLPGRVWAGDGDFQPVDDRRHHHNAYRYPFKQKHAWAWCYKRGVVKTPQDG